MKFPQIVRIKACGKLFYRQKNIGEILAKNDVLKWLWKMEKICMYFADIKLIFCTILEKICMCFVDVKYIFCTISLRGRFDAIERIVKTINKIYKKSLTKKARWQRFNISGFLKSKTIL